MDQYPDIYSKVALSLTSAQIAKEVLIADEGVGKDIPFNFFGWVGDELALVVQLTREFMKKDLQERFEMCLGALHAMRYFWGCDEVTFVAEGFHSQTPEMTAGKNLAALFADGNKNVRECVTVTHVSLGVDDSPNVMLISAPYSYINKEHIWWEDNVAYTQGAASVLREAIIPAMIAATLRGPCSDEDETLGEDPITMLNAAGFNVQEF